MRVWVASPYGLVVAYHLAHGGAHGGAQGDNMGVGYFMKVSKKWPEFLCYVVRHSLRPEDMCLGNLLPGACVPQQPVWPHRVLPEVDFSVNCRHFALSGWGPCTTHGPMRRGLRLGSAEVRKLKVYLLPAARRPPHLVHEGHTAHLPGALDQQTDGFMLTRVRLVMGDHPREQLAKAEANLEKVGRTLGALQPPYLLVLRVLLAFMVSALDYVYTVMPPHRQRPREVQRALDRVLTRALRVPHNVRLASLWTPPNHSGFGIPYLYTRMRPRHVRRV